MGKAFIKCRFTLDPKLAQHLTREDFDEIAERIYCLEQSMSVLLKQHESETSNITAGQLNRLKGGYTP